jgi:DNA-binding protein H-NS
MTDLQKLLEQKAALDKQIDAARKQARTDAIAKIKGLMAEYGLSAADLSAKSPAAKGTTRGKVAVKYRDKSTGDTWTGRGLQPKWLKAALAAGRKLDDFTV